MEKEIKMELEPIRINKEGGAVDSVNGQTGDVVLTTSDLENTSDYQTGTEVSSAISTAVGLEATARQNADNGLQGQIDALAASSDVTDIVGTYADLEAYDTSKLKDNDIIKVLQDESQNDETTYYRWSTSTESFTLIGEEGPYYTKAQTNTLLAGKLSDAQIRGQSIVTDGVAKIPVASGRYDEDKAGVVGVAAGNGVNISSGNLYLEKADNNLIAAKANNYRAIVPGNLDYAIEKGLGNNSLTWTDTEKSNARATIDAASTASFTGTDGVDAGTAGLVPAPATTDAGKFLKSDGTWDTAGGGSSVNVVQTTGTSTTDVMSQNAVTSMVFADPSTNEIVRISADNTATVGQRSVRIGHILGSLSTGAFCVGVGDRTNVSGDNSVGIGSQAGGNSSYITAVGHSAGPYGPGSNFSACIGYNAKVRSNAPNSVAIGANSLADAQGEVSFGSDGLVGGGYNNTNYRLLTHVYDGQSLHDAATVAQGNTLSDSAPTTSTVGVLGQLYTDTTNMHTYQCTAISGSTYTWTQRW